MARVYMMICCLRRYCSRCVWLARWRKDRSLASCIVIFSRHPAAGFRSFDHHSRPLPSTIRYHHRTSSRQTKTRKKKKREKKKWKWNENSIERARRTTRVRTYIKWSTHRYYNSFIFQGLSFRISPANTPLLYSLANYSASSFTSLPGAPRIVDRSRKHKQVKIIKLFKKNNFSLFSSAWLDIIFEFAKYIYETFRKKRKKCDRSTERNRTGASIARFFFGKMKKNFKIKNIKSRVFV